MSTHTQDEVEEVEHSHSVKPYYEAPRATNQWDRWIKQWSDSREDTEIDHSPNYNASRKQYPVVFDIETTAETPQRPILVTVYDSYSKRLVIAYDRGRDGYMPEDFEITKLQGQFEKRGYEVDKVNVLYSPNRSWFENEVLELIHEDPEFSDKKDGLGTPERVLVAHNAFFDLGVLGKPDDGFLDKMNVEKREWDGAFQYRKVSCMHKRAGAYGRLYSFRRGAKPLDIKVGDTATAAKSMWLPGSLEGLCEELDVDYIDNDTEHGTLTQDYVRYNVDDVAATLECWDRLQDYMDTAFSSGMNLTDIYSTASIAKNVLKRMGYERVHYSETAATVAAKGYFGGQTEALYPGEPVDGVTMTDILSQYPTVSALTGTWEYMQAEEVKAEEITVDELPEPTLEDLQTPETWSEISDYYVVLEASEPASLPVRTEVDVTETTRVYNAEVTHESGEGTIHHYMDYVGAAIRGEADGVEIKQAWKMEAVGQQDLDSTEIGETEIDGEDNVMKRCIEERKRLQDYYGEKNRVTKALKITANSCYGVSAERIIGEYGKPGDGSHVRHDIAGQFYSPHFASTCTAGGRLMLALGEVVAEQSGGELIYCDTDSFVVPDDCAETVIDAFSDLNPYGGVAGQLPTLEVEEGKKIVGWDDEEEEYVTEEIEIRDCTLYAVGVKKYAIMDGDGEIVKNTEHGLGHFKTLRDSGTVRKFWTSLIEEVFAFDVAQTRHPVLGDVTLTREEREEIIRWDESCSTMGIRQALSEKLGMEMRYGDFIERTIASDSESRRNYFGINLDESAIMVEHDVDTGEVSVEWVDDINTDGLKTVGDVLHSWKNDAIDNRAGRPRMHIVSQTAVTKEASDLRGVWNRLIERGVNQIGIDTLIEGIAG